MRFFTGVPSAVKKREGRPNGLGDNVGTLATSFFEIAVVDEAKTAFALSATVMLSATTELSATATLPAGEDATSG